jgi:hypothetical protein
VAAIRLPGRPDDLVVPKPLWAPTHRPPTSRRVFAAAHVAAFPDGSIDWASTLAFRHHLWDHGFGIADAMDTAQRGMGLRWSDARELIARSGAAAHARGGLIACGAGTDHLAAGVRHDLRAIRAAYEEQLEVVVAAGAVPILMASRALAAISASPDEYVDLYTRLIERAGQPVVLHWLGDAFDPALHGYWGTPDLSAAGDVVVQIAARASGLVDGVKVSLLDPPYELALRDRLPVGVRLYTGDDFNFAGLIRGDESGHSDALLGIFAAIAAPAAEALLALDAGDFAWYDAVMNPTEVLGRKIFEAPTSHYKVGIAFVAWLNGFQPHFSMIDAFESRRELAHLLDVFELAAAAGALLDPDLAIARVGELIEARSST